MKQVLYSQFKKDCCNNCVYNRYCNKNFDDNSYCKVTKELNNICEYATILYGVKTRVMVDE